MLLVLRTWLVYGASAAALLWLAHRFVRPLRPTVACLLALGPCLIAGKAMLTGGVLAPIDIPYASGEPLASYGREMGISAARTPLLSDVVNQYIPSRKAVREAIAHGRLPLWNRFSMGGEPLLAFLQPAALHPATWLGFALPLPNAWTFEMVFRLLVSMLSAYLFFREIGCRESSALLGAAGWALSDHLVFFLGYSVTASVGVFPLLLLGLRRIARAEASGIGVTVLTLVLMTLGGHPETLVQAVAAGGLFFLFELYGPGRKHLGRALGSALLSGALALGLTAVELLPFAEIAPHTETYYARRLWFASSKKSASLSESLRRSVRDVLPYAFGVSGRGRLADGSGLPAAYAGALVFPLAGLGFVTRKRERWIFAALGFLGLALWARLKGVTDVVGKLPLLDIAIHEYFVFLGCFGLVGLAVLGLDRLEDGGAGRALAAACLVWAAVTGGAFLAVRRELLALDMKPMDLGISLALQCAPLLLAAGACLPMRGRPPAAAGIVLAVFVAFRAAEAARVYPTCPARAFYPVPDVLRRLPAPVTDRIAALGETWIPDMPLIYGLQDVRSYGAMILADQRLTYPLWCVAQPMWFNRVDDATRPFLSFLNVRYVFGKPGSPIPSGWTLYAEGRGGRIFENPAVLPRSFVPGHVGWLRESGRQLEVLRDVTDFGAFGVVERGPDRPADSDSWELNGPGTVRILSDVGQRLVLDVEASGAAVVATSLPRWPGWKVRVDGAATPVLSYNRAFVGFRVPAGRHSVVLDYLPDGFVRGVRVSAATALAVIGLLVRRRLKRSGRGTEASA